MAAVALIAQLAGCATPLAPADRTGTTAAANPEKGKSPPSAAQDAKAHDEAVERGDAAWQAQDYDRAIYYYVQAMNKSPHDAATLAKMGAIEDARGNAALAEKAFAMAHDADPEEPRIAERLARLYVRAGKIDGAAEIYTQVLSRDPSRTRALDGMGEVCLARSDFAQAIRYFDRALQADKPDSAAVLTHRGYAKLRSNDLAGAEADLRAALAVAPRDDAWRYLGDVQVRRGDTGAALESLLNVMDTAQAYNEIGVTLMRIKNYQSAREYFTKAIRASPAWFDEAQKNLAVADERLRKSAG
jgi:tetratricopeptide (TPR) repeat protein